jgi:hypothetical protein
MNRTIFDFWVQFECRVPASVSLSKWFALPFTLPGDEVASRLLMAAAAAGAEESVATAKFAVAAAHFDGRSIATVERVGITAARLRDLIGFEPVAAQLEMTLDCDAQIHAATRLHPMLLRGRTAPPPIADMTA